MFNSEEQGAQDLRQKQEVLVARQDPELERTDSGHTEGHRVDTPNRSEPRSPDPTPEGGRKRTSWACLHIRCARKDNRY